MQSAFAPLAAAPTGVILPGVSAANPAPPSHLSPPRPAHGAGMSEAVMSAARPGPPRGAAADVESARAMATLSGLPADAPPEQYADAIRTAGAARLHELHRNAANVKLKTADGKNIWTLHVSVESRPPARCASSGRAWPAPLLPPPPAALPAAPRPPAGPTQRPGVPERAARGGGKASRREGSAPSAPAAAGQLGRVG